MRNPLARLGCLCVLSVAQVLGGGGSAHASGGEHAPFAAGGHALSAFTNASGPQAGAAFRRLGYRWPRGGITVFNGTRGNASAVRTAIRAWNRSGTKARFVLVRRRSRARVVIAHRSRRRGCSPGGSAQVRWDLRTRRADAALVLISRGHPAHIACSTWSQTLVIAHELGHVLGLAHEERRCALMNKRLMNLGPARCVQPLPHWRWHCRILEADDVRGAVRIYGGRVKRRTGRQTCDVVPPPISPRQLTLTAADLAGAVTVRFRRPPAHRQPAHLEQGGETYLMARAKGICPTSPDAAVAGGAWDVPVGGTQEVRTFAPDSGRYCFTVWAVDGNGRLSRPASAATTVTVPPPGP